MKPTPNIAKSARLLLRDVSFRLRPGEEKHAPQNALTLGLARRLSGQTAVIVISSTRNSRKTGTSSPRWT